MKYEVVKIDCIIGQGKHDSESGRKDWSEVDGHGKNGVEQKEIQRNTKII